MGGQKIDNHEAVDQQSGKLGAFAGVFTPSVLTILGIILFLRLGFVVGQMGLWKGLVIIGLANAISVLTSISLSAVATNLRVKGGGDYYLISRTLGVEFGGALGLVLFLAQSVSIAFYCLGFGEVLSDLMGPGPAWRGQLIALIAVGCLFILAWLGADWATRFQFVVMAILGAALVSFFWGGLGRLSMSLLEANWAGPQGGTFSFWAAFALFFPAVTGFTQGVSMSGDLKDPGRSLPLGTFTAVGLSILVYFGVALVFAASMSLKTLAGDYQAMKKVALFAPLIDAGVIAATLSSAMASFLGAPRILQSLAKDKTFPWLNFFAKGQGQANNPRRGVLLSLAIAVGTVGLGELNLIAPVVSMFFLISYGLLNYATYFESKTQSPSFRPRFRWFNARLSLLGALGCLACMLAIDARAGLMAAAILFGIHQYLKRSGLPSRWADSQRSHHLQKIRENLLAAAKEPEHARSWRPQILALSDHEERRSRLCGLASWLEGNSGLTSVLKIIEAQGPALAVKRDRAQEELTKELRRQAVSAFPLVVAGPDAQEAMETAIQAYGAGPLKANLLLLNWPEKEGGGDPNLDDLRYGRSLAAAFRLGVNLVVFKSSGPAWERLAQIPAEQKLIDLWWNDDPASRLMLLLAYLMTRSKDWDGAEIRALRSCQGEDRQCVTREMEQTFADYRIEAKPLAVEGGLEEMLRLSREASLVFAPFSIQGSQLLGPFQKPLAESARGLELAAFTAAAVELDLEAEPEEGEVAQVAHALDVLERRKMRLRNVESKAEQAREEAKQKQLVFQEPETIFQGEMFERLREAVEAQEKAQRLEKRAAKARVLRDDAEKLAKELGAGDKPDK